MNATHTLPVIVRQPLEQFCQSLQQSLRDQLVSVLLYGGLARGEYTHGRSDVNLLLVVRDATLPVLDQVLVALAPSRLKLPLSVMTLTESDLASAAEAFAIKFLEIQRHHVVLVGRDVCPELTITPDRLRRQCSRELMNLRMRLRQFYLQRSTRPELIENTLVETLPALLAILNLLVELKTGVTPSGRAETIETAHPLGVRTEALGLILALKRGDSKPDATELRRLYADYLACIQQASELARP